MTFRELEESAETAIRDQGPTAVLVLFERRAQHPATRAIIDGAEERLLPLAGDDGTAYMVPTVRTGARWVLDRIAAMRRLDRDESIMEAESGVD